MQIEDRMLKAGGSHLPTISVRRAATGSTMRATAGGAAPGSPSTAAREAAMERSGPLRCPRCDSSNTKFCYYNNYSLSQPRHFCKACKRYWTRGGTLRNVPVGGGCRKNKRARKHISSSSTSCSSAAATTSSSSAVTARIPSLPSDPQNTPIVTAAATAASETGLAPLFHGHAPAASQHNFSNPCVPYDLQSLGLFPFNADEDCLPVIKSRLTDQRILQQMAPAAPPTPSLSSLLQDSPIFGSNSLQASLHASSLRRQQQQQQQQQRMTQDPHLPPYTTLLSYGTTSENPQPPNDVKVEANGGITTRWSNSAGQSRFGWQTPTSCESALLETVAADSLHYWNAAAASAFGAGELTTVMARQRY